MTGSHIHPNLGQWNPNDSSRHASVWNLVGLTLRRVAQHGFYASPAMMHTTAIAIAGLVVYGASEMTVVSNFSFSISCMLILAIIADILILPALLMLGTKNSNPES